MSEEQDKKPKQTIPWGGIAKNMALVGGGYLGGYMGTGLAHHALSKTKFARQLVSTSAKRRNVIRHRTGVIAGLLANAAATALPHARDASMEEYVHGQMKKKADAASPRVAQVYLAYAAALDPE